ncbi:hypothetical protein ABIF79_008378 [Bradyrhizobium japonicum]
MKRYIFLFLFFQDSTLNTSNAQQLLGSGRSLDRDQVERLSKCVEVTFNEFSQSSISQCQTRTEYFPAGGGGHVRVKKPYRVPFEHYEFVAGTQSATQIGGQCEHNLYANWQGTATFQCEWETSGCGVGREGGHVRGYCSISIRYIPQAGDIAKIKEYCLAKEFGGGTKPIVSPVSCPELRWNY